MAAEVARMAGAGTLAPLPVARRAGVLPAEEYWGKRRGAHRRGGDTKTLRGSGKHFKLRGQTQSSHIVALNFRILIL